MDFTKLHERFKDQDSPSVELQLRWLQKHGFSQAIIDQAMIVVYSEVEKGRVFKSGAEFNLCLKDAARKLQTEEFSAHVKKLGEFEEMLRQTWNKDLFALAELERKKWPLWKKILLLKIEKLFK